jgi:hypothetical protein
LNGVIDRGDISLISNRRLREILLIFPEKFSWIKGVLNDDLDFSKDVVEPYLIGHISYLHTMGGGSVRPGSSGFQFPPLAFSPRDDFSHADIVRSREFQNIILHRSILLEDIVSLARTPDLEQQVDDVIRMIEQELR